MPHRDQYEIYIKCPKCGKQGEATWEEDESPVYGRGENQELISISDGFRVERKNSPQILCAFCDIPVAL